MSFKKIKTASAVFIYALKRRILPIESIFYTMGIRYKGKGIFDKIGENRKSGCDTVWIPYAYRSHTSVSVTAYIVMVYYAFFN